MRLQKKINKIIAEVYPDSNKSWVVGEPFTGGGGSLINMALDFPNWKFCINDLNPEVYTFWKYFAEHENLGDLYEKIRSTNADLDTYNRAFDTKYKTDLDRAFKVLFLNKTSFGGYITQKLPIGGQAQDKKWKVNCYWKPDNIIKKCEVARKALAGRILSVTNLDCNAFMGSQKFDFVYADPPYIAYGKQWYNCDFGIEALQEFRKNLVGNWCVSMDSIKSTDELFKNDRIEHVKVKYTAKSLNKKIDEDKELVVFPK